MWFFFTPEPPSIRKRCILTKNGGPRDRKRHTGNDGKWLTHKRSWLDQLVGIGFDPYPNMLTYHLSLCLPAFLQASSWARWFSFTILIKHHRKNRFWGIKTECEAFSISLEEKKVNKSQLNKHLGFPNRTHFQLQGLSQGFRTAGRFIHLQIVDLMAFLLVLWMLGRFISFATN